MGIRNIAEVKRGHQKLLTSTDKLFGEALEFAGEHAEQHVQRHADFRRRTGKLQDTTGHRVVKRGNSRILKIFNPQKYAAAIDTGAKPHIIPRFSAKKAGRFLRFNVGGVTLFRRSVGPIKHPGNRPYKFLFNATDAAHRVGGKFMRDGMSRIAKRF